jgi:uncharacterized RDD family membrane protein YckC
MNNSFRFETPENVQVHYEPAGLGTRFVAWFIDQVVLWVATLAFFLVLAVTGASLAGLFPEPSADSDDFATIMYYGFGFMLLVWSLGSFAYFGLCEVLFRGQTIGKRLSHIRVVKASGFQLDAVSVLVRNIFRVVDNLPPMWIFPVLSRLGQRAGDMVAGTIVVFDAPTELSPVRAFLAEQSAVATQFRFDHAMLKRLSSHDFDAIERVLGRLPQLSAEQRTQLLETYARQVATKLQTEPPPADRQLKFLEDLLATELRRQERSFA